GASLPKAEDERVDVITEEVVVEPLDNEAARRLRQRHIIIGGATVLALLLLIIWLLWPSKKTEVATEEANVVVSVRVAKALRQPIAAEVSSLGTIFPREQATVSPKINAQIKQMGLLKNRIVRAGQVVAVLESRDLQAQRAEALAAVREAQLNIRSVSGGANPQATAQAEKDLRDARANLDNARSLYERRLTLYKLGGIALKDVEAAQLALKQAENSLRLAERTAQLRTSTINPTDRALAESRATQAQDRLANLDAQLSYATIRAPITGVVTDQFQFEGEFAASGAKLLTVSDISEVIVKAQFADTVVANLKVGDPVTVIPTDHSSKQMKGQVSLVSRSSDPLNRTVEVWVNLGNGAGLLRAGGAAQVVVSTNQTGDAIVVPASAVTLEASNADAGTVMVVDAGNVAHERKVTVGIRTGELVQITSGLQEGETVVIEGNYALPDETKVEIAEDKPEGEEGAEGAEGEEGAGGKTGTDSNANTPATGEKP
ncbi:MAG TPA: efflux RND transporter periplasmic adaptor subunit, partial [Pyrinomonadaceae bacterium]|nr:efflux RND transporter periplasmic adaptor subunit [Pyrinomonadaceae bacterium]